MTSFQKLIAGFCIIGYIYLLVKVLNQNNKY